MSRGFFMSWLGMALLWAVCAGAQAHKPSDAYLQLSLADGIVEQRFDIALRDLDRDLLLDADDNGQLTWGEVRTRWHDIEQLALQGASLAADGQACQAGVPEVARLEQHSDGRYAVIVRRWTCPVAMRTLDVAYALFEKTDPTHRGIVRLRQGGLDQSAVLVPGAGAHGFQVAGQGGGAAAGSGRQVGLLGFVEEGIHHILIGTDHILFLLALLLPSVLVRRAGPDKSVAPEWQAAPALGPVLADVLRVVTAFTVAHSITLALAAFDVVDPPSRWVESTIAASVLFAALNNLFPWVREGRWKLTFGFGLVHGFGFASALKDLGLRQGDLAMPLFGFNLGVELGQLGIVAVFLLAIWRLRSTRRYTAWLLRGGSVAIAVLACLWLVERVMGLQWAWLN